MAEPNPQESSGPSRLLIPVLLSFLMAHSGVNIFPFVLGGLIDVRGLDSAAAGLLGSGELGGLALASIAAAGLVSRGRRRVWLLVGIGVTSVSQMLSSMDVGYGMLLAFRIATGLGEGLILAVGMATAAGAPNPTRLFAQAGAGVAFLMAGQIVVAPFIVGAYGPEGLFLALAIMAWVCAPLAVRLPNDSVVPEEVVVEAGKGSNSRLALFAIVSVAIMAVGQMMVWTVCERLGVSASLSAEAIGIVLAMGGLAGVLGSAAAAWIGTRYGNVSPVVLGTLAYAIATIAMVQVNVPVVYIVTNIVFGLAYAFLMPYIMGALAALDPSGRWTATAGGVQMFGAVAGPFLGGALAELGWWSVSLVIVVTVPIGLVLLWPALRFADRSSGDNGADATIGIG